MKTLNYALLFGLVLSLNSFGKSIAPPSARWTMESLARILDTSTPQGKVVAGTFDKIKDTNITAAHYKGSEQITHEDRTSTRRDTYVIVGSKSAVKLVRVVELSEPRRPWFQSRQTKVTYEVTPIQPGKTTTVEPEQDLLPER